MKTPMPSKKRKRPESLYFRIACQKCGWLFWSETRTETLCPKHRKTKQEIDHEHQTNEPHI